MTVSLILCTRDRPRLLSAALDSILAGETLPGELVIVDQSDALDPGFAGLDRNDSCEIRHIPTASRGLSRARNEGAKAARFPILVFTDDDVIVTPGWLSNLVEAALRGAGRTVVTGCVLPGADEGYAGFVPTLKPCRPAVYEGRVRSDPLVTFNMALYRETWERVGGFDVRLGPGTRFPGGEDNEFAYRVLEAGYGIECVPEAVLFHRAWRQASDYVPVRWAYGRGQGAFFAKHLRLQDPFILRRLTGSLARLAIRVPVRLFSNPSVPGRRLPRSSLISGDIALALGTLHGTLDWLLTERTRRSDR
ncbi:MAG: glycosyltransferase [Gemmatimonadetes bacterium]|nr:glycosyltransferase [Gemmatimonadota bacterium]